MTALWVTEVLLLFCTIVCPTARVVRRQLLSEVDVSVLDSQLLTPPCFVCCQALAPSDMKLLLLLQLLSATVSLCAAEDNRSG